MRRTGPTPNLLIFKRSPLKEQTMKQITFGLLGNKFKKQMMKILKDLRKVIDKNTDKKKKETKGRSKKNENTFAKVKAELKAMNNRLNNAEK